MRVLIENYRNLTAGHCGSGSMRNLIYHYTGLALDEGVVFGLGSGLDAVYFDYAHADPPYMCFGRGSSFETDVTDALGIDYRETANPDNDQAWEDVRQEVIAGRPTMLSGDIYYLDYRKFKVHFPGHRYVLLGFDDERDEVYVADRTDEATQTCSTEGVRLSRNPPGGLSTYNTWGKFHSGDVRHSLPEACGIALRKTAERMLNLDTSQRDLMAALRGNSEGKLSVGLEGLQTLVTIFPAWASLQDPEAHLQYLDNAIVKFGTGGGFFRDHYAAFMRWAAMQRPDLVDATLVALAEDAAREWNALSPTLQHIAAAPGDTSAWKQAQSALETIYDLESSLFGRLGDRVLKSV
ncbi:BtrH N-terminal domain-containing protein [Congregibacter litoralis]|uniref:A predicted NlpC/p60-like peptidase n=1 Tax=Congregibacter litoralis KT71 TaxID=314285 RepID=A4A740_9GAMM|nr:BtrH N-terminal domain-containing protein [Congregibacter litoralis]EAQ98109.1 A predicted NlpC/p60-like peptidase [Congregibacter litoralis KT71]